MKNTAAPSIILAGVILVLGCGGSGDGSAQDASVDRGPDGVADPPTEPTPVDGAIIADHAAVEAFESIPASTLDLIRSSYRFFYGHTSHGSQIMTGLDMLSAEDSTLYAVPDFDEVSDDLGHTGDVSWVPITEERLDASGSDYNVVIWSWCGGCSDNTEEGIDTYLGAMNDLEAAYPDVTFIYMTGHTDGSGTDGNLRVRNAQIRSWCAANGKILFDFEDIESWDPDGAYYPDISDDCGWCTDWCASHTCPDCSSCAHSHCYNCYVKGKAFWWMMARLAGWEG